MGWRVHDEGTLYVYYSPAHLVVTPQSIEAANASLRVRAVAPVDAVRADQLAVQPEHLRAAQLALFAYRLVSLEPFVLLAAIFVVPF
jgi:predicted homoserine dehydrogenase-like protein